MDSKVITICNKLNRKDSQTGLDVWYKHFLENVTYSIERVQNVNGTVTSVGEVFNILIPFNSGYLPYNEWKDSVNKNNHFTLQQGDYIFLDERLIEDVNPNSILAIRNAYKPRVCEIRSITEVPNRGFNKYQFKVVGI